MRVQSSRLVFLTRYRTKFREFLGEAVIGTMLEGLHPGVIFYPLHAASVSHAERYLLKREQPLHCPLRTRQSG